LGLGLVEIVAEDRPKSEMIAGAKHCSEGDKHPQERGSRFRVGA